jgi:hypothetical protein
MEIGVLECVLDSADFEKDLMTGFCEQAIKIQIAQKAGIFLKAERSLKTLLHGVYGIAYTHTKSHFVINVYIINNFYSE